MAPDRRMLVRLARELIAHNVSRAIRVLVCGVFTLAACVAPTVAAEPRRDAYGDALPDHAIARLGTVRFRHSYPVHEIFFFPDGRKLLTCDIGGGVHVWRLPSAQRLESWHFPGCLRFALAPDGKTLVGAADDGALLLIDTATGAIRDRLIGHATQVHALAVSRDSKWLASATWDWGEFDKDSPREKNLRLWNLQTRECVRTIDLPDNMTHALAFDGPGARLFTSGAKGLFDDGAIRVWNIASDAKPRDIPDLPAGAQLLYSPESDLVVAQRDTETIVALDGTTNAERAAIKVGKVFAIALSNDGTTVAAQPKNPNELARCTGVSLWDWKTGRQLREFKMPHVPLAPVKWSADDRFLAFSDERSVCVIDANTGNELFDNDEARYSIESIALAPGKKRLIAASERNRFERRIRVWEQMEPATFVGHQLGEPTEKVTGLAFSEPGSLVSASSNGTLKFWDVGTQKLRRKVFDGGKAISALTLSRDGQLAAFVHDDEIHIVDVDTGADSVLVKGDVRHTRNLAFTEDGFALLFEQGRQVKKCSRLTGQITDLLRPPLREFTTFSLSPDDKWLVMNRELPTVEPYDSDLIVFRMEQGDLVSVIEIPRERCPCAPVFSPDGKLLAGGTSVRVGKYHGKSIGGALHIWQTSGRKLARAPVDSAVSTLAFSRDGQWIVTGHDDSTILVWDVAGLLTEVNE